jgi:hypothetical protein
MSLVLHGSVILAIGGEAKDMSRIVTEMVLGREGVPSGHKVHNLPFGSLEG